jgi:hypothetical protein
MFFSFVIMPFNIASAVLELRNASEVDVDDRAIAVSSSTASIESFVHPQIRHYTSKTVHNRPILILHNVRQTVSHFLFYLLMFLLFSATSQWTARRIGCF